MSNNLRTGYPQEIMGFAISPAMQAADVAHDMAAGFDRYVPGGWKVKDAVGGIARAQVALARATPYVEALAAYENPGEQIAADQEEIRKAVELDLLSQNQGMSHEQAARSVTPGQVARSIGSLLSNRLFAPTTNPQALRTPLLRDLAEIYARERFGAKATPADLLKGRVPSDMILKAAAPEILIALGFAPNHPMVLSADRGGFVRSMGKMFAGGKLHAITRTPELARHVQAMLPPNGEQLRNNFLRVRQFVGALTTSQQVQRTR